MVNEGTLEEICSELGAIIERLDQLAFDALREAVAAKDTSRPEIDRQVVRARRALERAVRILSVVDE